jgi:putative membrane protein insertion efficiency factor
MRRRLVVAIALVMLALTLDAQRAPADQWSARALVAAIDVYQVTLSRWYAYIGVRCRFTPTCSHYGEACIQQFGAVRGGWLALKRVLRCGPWTPMGTQDPPPLNSRRPSSFSSTQQA